MCVFCLMHRRSLNLAKALANDDLHIALDSFLSAPKNITWTRKASCNPFGEIVLLFGELIVTSTCSMLLRFNLHNQHALLLIWKVRDSFWLAEQCSPLEDRKNT